MERAEAEAVYEQGRETVVAVLLELSAQNALLRREVAELSKRLAKQEERIAELERRLNRNSRNSSLPPSQDPPAAPERRQASSSGRGRGAQPGHPGRGRHLAPIESLDELVEHWPRRCRCGHVFCAAERPRAIRSRSCRRPRSSSASIACNGYVARTAAPRRALNCRPGCRREPSALASRRRSPPWRCATASRGAIPQSSCASCLAPSSRPARSTPSCSTRARRSQSPTLSLQTRSAAPRPCAA